MEALHGYALFACYPLEFFLLRVGLCHSFHALEEFGGLECILVLIEIHNAVYFVLLLALLLLGLLFLNLFDEEPVSY